MWRTGQKDTTVLRSKSIKIRIVVQSRLTFEDRQAAEMEGGEVDDEDDEEQERNLSLLSSAIGKESSIAAPASKKFNSGTQDTGAMGECSEENDGGCNEDASSGVYVKHDIWFLIIESYCVEYLLFMLALM